MTKSPKIKYTATFPMPDGDTIEVSRTTHRSYSEAWIVVYEQPDVARGEMLTRHGFSRTQSLADSELARWINAAKKDPKLLIVHYTRMVGVKVAT